MSRLAAFLSSPLARRPELLARKIRERLGAGGAAEAALPDGLGRADYPRHWENSLRAWLDGVPWRRELPAFHRVFGVEFDETFLLESCRRGPPRGERGLRADTRLAWEYSRGYPLFSGAAALGKASLPASAAFLRRWSAATEDRSGPVWTCAMEVAIRAVNQAFADTLLGGALAEALGPGEWARRLWRHGAAVHQRLEARLIPSNHYLADLLGLLVVGSSFPADSQAQGWKRLAVAEFPRALLSQTRADGGLNEASLRYHAYVTEMALLFRLAAGGSWSVPAEKRLAQMVQVIADFRDASGDVFALGDDDSGRVLALDEMSPLPRAGLVLKLAAALGLPAASRAEAFYPQSGWWVRRAGDFAVAVDFGGVGLRGQGAHAHNDDFSICVDWRGQPLIVDPGTGIYTGDPAVRERFRSTFAHNTVIVAGQEQRRPGPDLFRLRGRDKAYPAAWRAGAGWAATRAAAAGVAHRREVELTPEKLRLRDRLTGAGRHPLQWRFHLPPAAEARVCEDAFLIRLPEGVLRLKPQAAKLDLSVQAAEFSAKYGHLTSARVCVAQMTPALPCEVAWELEAVHAGVTP